MTQPSQVRNPFMLMVQPEVVLAAIENSERLSQLNRHLCRPLDRQQALASGSSNEAAGLDGDIDDRE